MIGEKEKDGNARQPESSAARSQGQLKRLMYEKGYLAALTASIADIDLTYPGVKRTVKHILRVLRVLTHTGIHLSQANILPPSPADVGGEDEIASTSSLSEMDDDREETPDLYRNSALGMLEPGREDDFSEDSEDGLLASPSFTALSVALADTMVDDEEMYDDEYGDDLGYDEEMSEDGEEDVSDDDEELGEMGEIEGLPGDAGVVEVIMGEDDDDDDDEDMDEDDDDSEDDSDDDDMGSEGMQEMDDQIEIVDDEGNPIDDDGASGWESDTDEDADDAAEDEADYEAEAQDMDEAAQMMPGIDNDELGSYFVRAAMEAEPDFGDDMRDFEDRYIDDGGEDDGILPWPLHRSFSFCLC